METYQQMKERHSKAYGELPIMYAFSDEQFEKGLAEFGCTIEEVVSIGYGGFMPKADVPRLKAYLDQSSAEEAEAMKDAEFAYGAFLYEIGNHEYHINWQSDWDVFSCFGHVEYGEDKGAGAYMDDLGFEPQTKAAFYRARKEFCRQCDESERW